MRRAIVHSLLAISLLLPASGCARLRERFRKKERPAVVATPFHGTVSLVNEEQRFVLIDSGYGQIPDDGARLRSFTGAAFSAELVVSRERRRPFVIADIVSGSPKVGDRVEETKTPEAQRAGAVSIEDQ